MPLKVKVGELQAKEEADDKQDEEKDAVPAAPKADKVDDLGISIAPLTDTLRTRYDVKKTINGLVVTNVVADSIATDQGIQVGDVISEASQQDLKTSKELVDQAKQAKKDGKPLLLLINRKDDMRFVAITFGKKK